VLAFLGRRSLALALLLIIIIPNTSLKASNYDYIYPFNSPSYSNYGSVGLIQMPSARMQEEGTIAFNWIGNDPYTRGSILAYPFNWFEASYQYTDINNAYYSNVKEFSGNQTYKDKSFDIKLRLLKETKYLPSIAVGARDLAGTGIFGSEYIVGSKLYKNIDFSFGMGWGTLSSNNIKNPFSYISDEFDSRTGANTDTMGGDFNVGSFFSGQAGLFGGVEIFLPNFHGSRIKIEYDGTDYTKEGFPFGASSFKLAFESVKPQKSKVNIGFVYPITDNVHFKIGYTKGNTFNIGLSMKAGMKGKNPALRKRDDLVEVENAEVVKFVNKRGGKDYIYKSSLLYLNERKMPVQKAHLKDDNFEVVYAQNTFISYPRATGRVYTVLDSILPDNIKSITISNVNGGMLLNQITIDRDKFNLFKEDKLAKPLEKSIAVKSALYDRERYEFQPLIKRPSNFWKLAPSVRSQIGGPDGFYFGDLSLAFHSETIFQDNLTLVTAAAAGIYDTFDGLKLASDSILPHVRSDIVSYLKESRDFHIKRFQLNKFFNPTNDFYAKITAGLMESMFGGIGGEILYRPFGKTWAVGVEAWNVKQRDYDQLFDFRKYRTTTGHINLYYEEPITNILFKIKGGRFLAKDSGINFDFSRRFKSGLSIGAFFAVTDISKYEFGEGSFDKGFYFHIPIEFFFDRYTKGISGFGLRPLTRDGAAILTHSHNLYAVTDQANQFNFMRTWESFYD